MRDIELLADQIEGYLFALGDLRPVAVHDALAGLWRDAGSKAMPTPGEIRARAAADARAAVARTPLLAAPWPDDDDRAQSQRHIDEWKRTSPLFNGGTT